MDFPLPSPPSNTISRLRSGSLAFCARRARAPAARMMAAPIHSVRRTPGTLKSADPRLSSPSTSAFDTSSSNRDTRGASDREISMQSRDSVYSVANVRPRSSSSTPSWRMVKPST